MPEEAPAPEFQDALARFASGVTIVTAVDNDGRAWGFTASAFSSLSLRPPLILVCLDQSANCYATFTRTSRIVISILAEDHDQLALRFASKKQDKFAAGGFAHELHENIPAVSDALASLLCRVDRRIEAGDHMIVIAEVEKASAADGSPLVYFRRDFHAIHARG